MRAAPSLPYRRLLNQRIAGAKLGKPEQVVKHFGALQAQDYNQALWAIGLRMRSATVMDIEQSIEDRKIMLTWPMRGTIHFVPPEDARWMLKLSAPRVLAKDKRRLEQLELTPENIESCKQIIHDALQGNKRISRPNIMQLLEEAGICTKNQRGYHLLWHLAQSGLICLGPREGKQQTFVLLDEWVPRPKDVSVSEALALLAERYFGGHGPATAKDFGWWAGITLSDARQGIEAAQSRLISESVNGEIYWSSPSECVALEERPSVCLLPGFDEYLLGYTDRNAVLRAEYAPFIVPGNNGVFMPIVVIDGQVAGIWKRTVKNKGIDIEISLFVPQKEREESLMDAALQYCTFMGLPLASTSIQLMK
ncbi:winged helix DNA-binding domain-containing protein [Paenibacillus sp. sptzw28]|uniref:winged helix DNA-binding domain-containing protein n=1 Tax=Paenibacillus sp. sptzw28 TaxID=715179 RepID=UPI001C6DDED7|nr:winged helix DNA-binding domain-containing protein [Paenibacillus sp. sptzw28]QYR23771.1 winged helix DNA-binding domain-containing protein [Paenibacillus sp. sptzw28]